MEDVRQPAEELAAAIEAALPAWVEGCVDARYRAAMGGPPPAHVRAAASAAGDAARAEIAPRVRALLDADIDAQSTTPLAVVRGAVGYPTHVLSEAGVPVVARDRFEEDRFPDDVYNLTPATFSDLGPGVRDAGIAWGAAKAWAHKHRHAAS